MATTKMAKSPPKRKFLNLKEKIELIEYAEKSKLSTRQLAQRFSIGKSQISKLLKHKDELRISLTKTENVHRKRKFPTTQNAVLDQLVYEWYKDSKTKNVTITGPLIQRKALDVAQQLKIQSFKASNGWLDKFCHRWNINLKSHQSEAKNSKTEKLEVDCEEKPAVKEVVIKEEPPERTPTLLRGAPSEETLQYLRLLYNHFKKL